ncbi:rhomboid family intramembrane serine protease [Mariluticola halotolerans]|uniref:rhomboid family intramembrane serine protease n=1 Tax=Mariluticola halotolerans TaxID=2909283 RepID=UPI0026E134C3|nr:rhomboid family intramembrane serine protease [Mariluticola halotolerans]UJQ95336.1 rhomboid family intramembrane serine protease [Mariluticola halotolerans]
MSDDRNNNAEGHQPIFTLPQTVLYSVAFLVLVHVATLFVLDAEGRNQLIIWFAFIPLRVTDFAGAPGGAWPLLWTPFTHALMHASWEHVLINAAWLAIFGTPVARRYGPVLFLIVFFISALAGAFAYLLTAWGQVGVLVGASGGISGLTGVAVRFVFQPPVVIARDPETGAPVGYGRQLLPLAGLLRNSRARAFTLIWIGLNAITPLLPLVTGGGGIAIAWQAHLGGFFAGLLLATLCDQQARREFNRNTPQSD